MELEDGNSLSQYGGIVGDNEDDEVERSAVVNDKQSKRLGGPSNYVRTFLSPSKQQTQR
jgi:hypothetical protein